MNIQLPENTKIETLTVFNVMGQEVTKLDKQNSAEKISLDVSNYAMGIYYLYVVSDGKVGIKKISVLR